MGGLGGYRAEESHLAAQAIFGISEYRLHRGHVRPHGPGVLGRASPGHKELPTIPNHQVERTPS